MSSSCHYRQGRQFDASTTQPRNFHFKWQPLPCSSGRWQLAENNRILRHYGPRHHHHHHQQRVTNEFLLCVCVTFFRQLHNRVSHNNFLSLNSLYHGLKEFKLLRDFIILLRITIKFKSLLLLFTSEEKKV